MTSRTSSAGWLLVGFVIVSSGCGPSDNVVTAERVTTVTTSAATQSPTSSVTHRVEPAVDERPDLPFGFTRCEELLSAGVVTGPLSDDPQIAAAQQWRAHNGLRSDEEWVRQVPTMNRESVYANAFDAPMTDEEVEDFTNRPEPFDEAGLNAYLTPYADTIGGMWTDLVTRQWTVSFTSDVETRRQEIEAQFPGIRVVEANMTEAELRELQTQMLAELIERGLGSGAGEYIQAGGGVVGLDVAVLDRSTVAGVAEFADPATVCLRGQEVDRYTPPGPQAESGPGWRLLGLEPVDVAFQAVFDRAGLETLWAQFAPTRPIPTVDFDVKMVAAIPTSGRGVTNGPCGTRFDGWTFEDGVLQLDLPQPGGASACHLVAAPGSYLIEIDASGFPEGDITAEVVRKQMDVPVMSATFSR